MDKQKKENKRMLVVSNMYPDRKHPYYGTFIKNICNQLNNLKISYDLLVMYQHDSKISKMFWYLFFYIKCFFACLNPKYDTVYVHYVSYSGQPVLLAHMFRKFKIIANVHGSDVIANTTKQKKMYKYTQQIMPLAEKVVVPSEYFKQVVSKQCRISLEKICVYPSGGVNIEVFKQISNENLDNFCSKYSFNQRRTYFGFVSRMTKEKGWDTFLAAAELVHAENDRVEFIMVGNGEDEAEINERILASNMKTVMHCFPLQDQETLPYFYSLMKAFVFPSASKSESLGLVAIEAMACGTPVLASDYAAEQYYVSNGINGFKFPLRDVNALKECILKIASMPSAEYQMLREGSIRTAMQYSSISAEKMLQNIFKNLVTIHE